MTIVITPMRLQKVVNIISIACYYVVSATLLLCCCCYSCEAFVAVVTNNNPVDIRTTTATSTSTSTKYISTSSSSALYNIYDDWRSDAYIESIHLDEDHVITCLEEFVMSDYGTSMFGCHDRASQIGITGSIQFVELCGPEVTLTLEGEFWHKRSFVLGRAAVWLNARIPEITDVIVNDMEDLNDYKEILDKYGDVIYRKDKRSEDYNGDREIMEYQGMDPDMRGPFPSSPLNPMGGDSMINPM